MTKINQNCNLDMEGLKMEKVTGTERGKFESNYDSKQGRVSYNLEFRDHYCEKLAFISGVLSLVNLIDMRDGNGMELNEDVAFVIMEAMDTIKELRDSL